MTYINEEKESSFCRMKMSQSLFQVYSTVTPVEPLTTAKSVTSITSETMFNTVTRFDLSLEVANRVDRCPLSMGVEAPVAGTGT